MYNRYIPQPDGSYRRSSTPDRAPTKPPAQKSKPPAPAPEPEPASEPCIPVAEPVRHQHRQQELPHREPRQGVGDFLRQILPKDFDTADLLILVLLLLMAGDDPEDRNCALLTLALYLFL